MTPKHNPRSIARWAPLALVSLLCFPNPTAAQSPYRLAPGREWTLVGIGAGLNLGGLALINEIEPFTQSELALLDPADVNSFDRSGMEPYRSDDAGDALLAASFALPFTLLADSRTREDWKTLGVMWGEVLLLQAGVTAVTKGLTERARPYAYDSGAPLDVRTNRDAKTSFFSGHTSATAATCFYVGKVVSDYPFSKTTKTLVWGAAAVYPAVVGFLRVDSGHHFRTDVITGYLAGAAIGFLVPHLHRTPRSSDGAVGANLSAGKLTFVVRF